MGSTSLGSGYAELFATGHELENLLEGSPLQEIMMDLHNNRVGREAGERRGLYDIEDLLTLDHFRDSDYPDACQPY